MRELGQDYYTHMFANRKIMAKELNFLKHLPDPLGVEVRYAEAKVSDDQRAKCFRGKICRPYRPRHALSELELPGFAVCVEAQSWRPIQTRAEKGMSGSGSAKLRNFLMFSELVLSTCILGDPYTFRSVLERAKEQIDLLSDQTLCVAGQEARSAWIVIAGKITAAWQVD